MENNKDSTVELVFISCMILLQWQKFRNKLEVIENISLTWNNNRREMIKMWKEIVGEQPKLKRLQQESQQRIVLQPYLRLITVSNTLMRWSFWLLFLVACRRLLTQLEAAKGSRGGAPGDGKPAPAKGPDGVVLYELHSRREQEKFTESAKVCSSCHVFSSHERNVWIPNEGKQREKGVWMCVWVGWSLGVTASHVFCVASL